MIGNKSAFGSNSQSRIRIPELKSILIVKLGSLGDIVHALPLANAVRDNLPDARIDWIIGRKFSGLLEHHPAIDEVVVFDRRKSPLRTFLSLMKVIRKLRSKNYDILMDLQGNLKGSPIVLLSRCSRRMGFRRGSSRIETASTFFTNWKVAEEGSHIIERNLSFARALGIEERKVSFRVPVAVSAKRYVDNFLRSEDIHRKRIVIMHPGVTWASKRWPVMNYVRLAKEIIQRFPEVAIVATFGPGEQALEAKLKESYTENTIIVATAVSLSQLIALIDRCEVFIGSDTGPLHVAVALGKRVIGLYGPTDPARNGPYGEGNFVITRDKTCSACWQRNCRDLSCMNEIEVSHVMEKVAICMEERNVLRAA